MSVYVLKFAKFVQWNDEDKFRKNGKFTICVYSGREELGRAFMQLNGADTGVGLAEIRILPPQRLDTPQGAPECRLVFIGSDVEVSAAAMHRLRIGDAVVVSEATGPLRLGDIQFKIRDDRLQFAVNRRPDERPPFRFNASLLLLASEVL